ncbi:hypothetical protein CSUI_001800 [Cystoisospora suis]|uniref:Uncharacterized protein n=1 Tax=Cystoisospora suis TaxID=483139 RepID=A0A2C6L763_9APIC|nr:hypothetical protein CSUI_001800 [Cystoisospora suis]
MTGGVFPILEGGGGEGNRTVLMRVKDILSTSLAFKSPSCSCFEYTPPRLLSSFSHSGFASPSQPFSFPPNSSPFFIPSSSSFCPSVSPQQRPLCLPGHPLASSSPLGFPRRSFSGVSSLNFIIFPETDRSFSSSLRFRTEFRRGVRTEPKPTQNDGHLQAKNISSSSKTDTSNAEEKKKQGSLKRKTDEHLTASLTSSSSPLSSSSEDMQTRGERRGKGEHSSSLRSRRFSSCSPSKETDAESLKAGGTSEKDKEQGRQELTKKKRVESCRDLPANEEEEISTVLDQSYVGSEEDPLSREASLEKKKNKKRIIDQAEKNPRAQSLEEGPPLSVGRRIDGRKRKEQEEDTSPSFSTEHSSSIPNKSSVNELSSSSSSSSSSRSEPSSTFHDNEGSEGEEEETSSAFSSPVSGHASLLSQRSPYTRFDCMRTSQEEPLLKDALSKFKSIVKEQTERRGGKGWHVYEGWPPRSRIPLGNEQSKFGPLNRRVFVFNRRSGCGRRRIPTLVICCASKPVLMLDEPEFEALVQKLPWIKHEMTEFKKLL